MTDGTLAVSAVLDAPPGVVLLGATVSARDANDPSRAIRLESAPERVRVRPVAKVTLDSLAADLANVRLGGGDARLSLRATNTGLGDGLLSDLVLAFTDAAGAVVTDAWTVTSAPALRDDPLAAGASRVLTASVRRNPQATTGAASTSAAWTSERAEERVRARLQVRTAERVDALEPPASTQAPWSFNIMPLMLEEIPPPPGYAAGARLGAALALLNDPEDGASIYVIGAPGLTPSGLLSVWVAPHQLLGTIDAPRGGDFGAAIAAVGHWLPASPANRDRRGGRETVVLATISPSMPWSMAARTMRS